MQHIITYLFLIASGVGATIIVSRGDIFKGFRAWVDRMSIKKKWFVHDISLPEGSTISVITIDNKPNPVEISAKHMDLIESEILKLPALSTDKYLNVKVRKEGKDTRIFIETKERHMFSFLLKDKPLTDFNVYENSTRIGWVKFFSSLLECPMCTGMWMGMIFYVFYFLGLMQYWWFLMFCTGNIVSVVAYLYFKLYVFLEKK